MTSYREPMEPYEWEQQQKADQAWRDLNEERDDLRRKLAEAEKSLARVRRLASDDSMKEQQRAEAAEAKLAEAERELSREERDHLNTIDHRDQHESRINAIVAELGLGEYESSWTSLNDPSERAIEAINALRQRAEAAEAKLAEAEREIARLESLREMEALAVVNGAAMVERAEKRTEAAEAKLAFLKTKGLTVALAKDADQPERLVYVIEEGSELCDLATLSKLTDAEVKLATTEAKVKELLAYIRSCSDLLEGDGLLYVKLGRFIRQQQAECKQLRGLQTNPSLEKKE